MSKTGWPLTRRGFVMGCACGGLGAAAPGFAQGRRAGAIDVHYHATTQTMKDVAARGGQPIPFPVWEAGKALEEMDQQGVEMSIISMPVVSSTAPQEDAAHRAFARKFNEDAAQIVRDHPKRFRFFAYVPMPFQHASLDEMAYALDTLGADGIYLCTSYGDKWLGDASFTPVMAELDRRKAVVFTHPMGASCCLAVQPGIGPAIIEYGVDTTRTIASLIFSGAAARYPNIRFIFSHAGGVAPYLFERLDRESNRRKLTPDQGAATILKRFFYDTAQATNPHALGGLSRLVPESQILFGSDYAWRSAGEQLKALDGLGFKAGTVDAIRRGNALKLLPTLQRARA